MGQVCCFKLTNVYNIVSFLFCFLKFVTSIRFFSWHIQGSCFQNLGYVPLIKNELISKTATVSEQCLLFKRANMHPEYTKIHEYAFKAKGSLCCEFIIHKSLCYVYLLMNLQFSNIYSQTTS